MLYLSHTPDETAKIAFAFVAGLHPTSTGATVVALTGDLGAGKTAFVQGVARALGVDENVTSPTFVLQKIYPIAGDTRFRHLVHMDMYRLESPDDLSHLGWEEIIRDKDALVCIEWADKIAAALPADTHHFSFSAGEEAHIRIISDSVVV